MVLYKILKKKKELNNYQTGVIIIIILALDQASRSGFSVFKDGELFDYGYLDYGKYSVSERNSLIKSSINDLIEEYQPQLVALENTQYQNNADVHKVLCMLLGVLDNYLYESGMDYAIVSSKTWKSTCGIKGKKRAEQKKNAQLFVLNKFGLEVSEDEADAICIGWHMVVNYENSLTN